MDVDLIDSGCGCRGQKPPGQACGCGCDGNPPEAGALGINERYTRQVPPLAFTEAWFVVLVTYLPTIAQVDVQLQAMIAGVLDWAGFDAGWPGAELGITYTLPPDVGGTQQYAERLIGKPKGALRWKQLRDVNIGRVDPDTGKTFEVGVDGNLSPLEPYLTILVPDSWAALIDEQLAAVGTIPGLKMPPIDIIAPGPEPIGGGGGGGSVALSAAAIAQAQAMLGAWGKSTGKIEPPGYGQQPTDYTGVQDSRTTTAARSFQRWANSTRGTALRTDGIIDEPTRNELSTVVAGVLVELPGTGEVPGVPGVPELPGGAGKNEKKDGGGALILGGLAVVASLLK